MKTLEILEGQLPKRALNLIMEWALEHRVELLDNWEKAQRGEALLSIAPLE